jgi:hypothetical protein
MNAPAKCSALPADGRRGPRAEGGWEEERAAGFAVPIAALLIEGFTLNFADHGAGQ